MQTQRIKALAKAADRYFNGTARGSEMVTVEKISTHVLEIRTELLLDEARGMIEAIQRLGYDIDPMGGCVYRVVDWKRIK